MNLTPAATPARSVTLSPGIASLWVVVVKPTPNPTPTPVPHPSRRLVGDYDIGVNREPYPGPKTFPLCPGANQIPFFLQGRFRVAY